MLIQHFRSGDIVTALLPGKGGVRKPVVAIVLSVWISTKKPRLATSTAPLAHCVAARICIMKPCPDDGALKFRCDAFCPAWVIKPESITAVLAFDDCQNETEFCQVSLNAESRALMESMQ